MQHRTGGRGDDADALRQPRQRLLVRAVEQAFLGEPVSELFVGAAQRAFTGLFQGFDNKLVVATPFVQADALAPAPACRLSALR